MSDLTLYIGDKTLSSWSLRPWLAMKQAGLAFREETIRLDRPETAGELKAKTTGGLVPCLRHGDIVIGESIAILEYLAESFPEKRLWPADRAARAEARAVSAEMHAGFAELRKVWPMNFTRRDMRHLQPASVKRDIARIDAIWTGCRARYAAGGPFLFGEFSIADAMYAPVVSRFMTYGPVSLSAPAAAWANMLFALPAMREWGEGAARELG